MKRKLKQRWSAIPLISNYWINYPHHKNKSKKKKKKKEKEKEKEHDIWYCFIKNIW